VRIPEQVQRLARVIGFIVGVTLIVRFFVIPRSLVANDLHEATTVQREMAKPVKFAGSATCQMCHADAFERLRGGYHKTLSCEGCHGPAIKHAENPMGGKPPAPRDRKSCPVCHVYDASRPTGFPQINLTAHNPLKPCVECHKPHDPVPQKVPQACEACHAQIERTKAVSSHALLNCTTCHTVPGRHKTEPRSTRPSIPQRREFCGTCHAKDAAEKHAPKVDMTTHGMPYLCWQCHYPHLPEGRG
jgi:hypothetical protein